MINHIRGTVTGTGATLNKVIGFKAAILKIYNPNTGAKIEWTSDMGAAAGFKEGGVRTGLISTPACAIASTPANVANGAFSYYIFGVRYYKAATAAGTAPTATTIPQNKYGLFGYEIGADGTIDKKDAADNATGYNTAALALAALPTASASHLLFMYVIVMRTNAAGFVGATTSFADAETTVTYNNVARSNSCTTLGITAYDGVLGQGFTLGADTDVNVLGDTLYFEAWGE
jgi:hypothetical protein